MKKVIGIVGEGPIDQMVLKAAINRITGESHVYRNIQPEQDMRGEFGNGWKGVYRWCEKNAALIPALFSEISPALDLLVIQMDGDVARKEKEIHCHCESTICPVGDKTSPLECRRAQAGNCVVMLPCEDHENSPDGYRNHLRELLFCLLERPEYSDRLIFAVPCDSTDAWTVAAYEEDIEEIETIADPWEHVISLKKEYHGIRIPGHKKSTTIYRLLIPRIIQNWPAVTQKCKSALKFEIDIRNWGLK